MPQQKFYLTTPIYYVNARPHIGHAYSTIAADVIARRHRLLGEDTFFLTGTDEHGQKVERSAAAAGVAPQQFADQVSASFRGLWDRVGITYDGYIRTTDDRHKQGVQRLWKHLEDRGAIYLSTYTGQYSVGEEMFVDGPPGTIGPDGKPTETVTEENYFFKLSEYQLPLLNLIESGELAIQPESSRNEVLSFLRGNVVSSAGMMTIGEPGILEQGLNFAEVNEGLLRGKLRRSKAGFLYVPGALKDLSISRTSFKWGIPVPDNEKHVIYVWLDALANYMTAIGYGSDDTTEQERFRRYWPADLHLVGKEITRFHCVYWPAFLLAAGIATPKSVVANGWLLFDDSKMSKSKGNVVRTETILDAFGEQVYKKQFPESTKREQDLFASDVLRYFLLREIPFGQDGSFSFEAMVTRYNADLANGYGNLVSRTLSQVHKNFGGVLPNPSTCLRAISVNELIACEEQQKKIGGYIRSQALQDFNSQWIAEETIAKVSGSLSEGDFYTALSNLWAYLAHVDRQLTMSAPWKLMSDQSKRQDVADILYVATEFIRIFTALLYPILPYTTAKVWAQLGLGEIEVAAKSGKLKNLEWGGLRPGTKLGELAPIFPRAEKGLVQIMTDMESSSAPPQSKLVDEKTAHTSAAPADPTHPGAAPRTSSFTEERPGASVGGSHSAITERASTPPHSEAPASGPFAASAVGSATPDTPQIAIDDFVKIDLRVAQIVVAERIPKADKLLRLEVDLGYERRQILSGIAEWYTPEELVGRRIVVIANLTPRTMRGLESHGMLLAASHGENGKPVLATFGEEIALGSRLR